MTLIRSLPLRAPRLTPPMATLAVIAACVSFGMVPLFARLLQDAGMSAASIGFFRYASSALVMFPFLPLAREKRRDALRMLGAGIMMGIGWVSYLEALETQSVAMVGLVYMTYPVFALLLAWMLARQTPTLRAWGGCALVLAAALMIFEGGAGGGTGGGASWALVLSLPAPIMFALIIVVLTCLTPRLTSMEQLACAMVGCVIGLAPLVALTDPAAFVPRDGGVWLTLLAMGLVTALIPQMVYTIAAPKIGPGRSSAAGAVELPTMIALGWLAFGETVGVREIAASGLVLAAILLVPPIAAPRPQPA
ncbi:EamA family transporter [Thalassobaculum sp. OXR-137]|uniref:DMT family transporter n=1 Tax=Thalassobaculum sp. OXR-137 TaxID=3100173 RepID=UPI002AC9EDD1|nr:EamA family transporter [Thalassobaculum sp. OXR-137]WPZ33345.1 EamA family transporter [Thalassobaculum sp. OXR-137]